MEWSNLLSVKRVDGVGELSCDTVADEQRSEFVRDFSRVLYSNAFRRLHNKTQVFPMPLNDHIHSRLTHSIEVADFGKNLGNSVGLAVIEASTEMRHLEKWDIGYIVAAACLAHDIGNPPFGHQGEDAISSYFRQVGSLGYRLVADLPDQEARDFREFEGNAQAFRILTRKSERKDKGGMRLTAGTLGAFSKYPQCSLSVDPEAEASSRRKFGFFASEQGLFETVANELGLVQRNVTQGTAWCRHPLAFITEAADDICYGILDLEDGYCLGLVPSKEYHGAIEAIASGQGAVLNTKLPEDEQVGYLRAKAMGVLSAETVSVFLGRQEDILAGTFDKPLVQEIPSAGKVKELRRLVEKYCYSAPAVVQIETAGYRVVHTLLEHFISCATERKKRRLLWDVDCPDEQSPVVDKLRWAVDYVSGMTDRYAVNLYRHLMGISLPEYGT